MENLNGINGRDLELDATTDGELQRRKKIRDAINKDLPSGIRNRNNAYVLREALVKLNELLKEATATGRMPYSVEIARTKISVLKEKLREVGEDEVAVKKIVSKEKGEEEKTAKSTPIKASTNATPPHQKPLTSVTPSTPSTPAVATVLGPTAPLAQIASAVTLMMSGDEGLKNKGRQTLIQLRHEGNPDDRIPSALERLLNAKTSDEMNVVMKELRNP